MERTWETGEYDRSREREREMKDEPGTLNGFSSSL
jgi:hypothetical protein